MVPTIPEGGRLSSRVVFCPTAEFCESEVEKADSMAYCATVWLVASAGAIEVLEGSGEVNGRNPTPALDEVSVVDVEVPPRPMMM